MGHEVVYEVQDCEPIHILVKFVALTKTCTEIVLEESVVHGDAVEFCFHLGGLIKVIDLDKVPHVPNHCFSFTDIHRQMEKTR
jgi:hypothetical protein